MNGNNKLSIFFDTNIILAYKEKMPSFYEVKASTIFNDTCYYIKELQDKGYDIEICIVDIVVEEMKQHMKHARVEQLKKISDCKNETERVLGTYVKVEVLNNIPEEIEQHIDVVVRAFVSENNIKIVNYSPDILEKLVKKAIHKTHPFVESKRTHRLPSAWKDTIIYATALDYKTKNERIVIFCTNDSDFDDLLKSSPVKIVNTNVTDPLELIKKQINGALNISDELIILWVIDEKEKTKLSELISDTIKIEGDIDLIQIIADKNNKGQYKVQCKVNEEDITVVYDSFSHQFSWDGEEDDR